MKNRCEEIVGKVESGHLEPKEAVIELLVLFDVSQQSEVLNAFVEEFVEAWEDGMGVDTDLYRKAKSLL